MNRRDLALLERAFVAEVDGAITGTLHIASLPLFAIGFIAIIILVGAIGAFLIVRAIVLRRKCNTKMPLGRGRGSPP